LTTKGEKKNRILKKESSGKRVPELAIKIITKSLAQTNQKEGQNLHGGRKKGTAKTRTEKITLRGKHSSGPSPNLHAQITAVGEVGV